MHIEFLTEDSSTARLLEHLLPKLIGANGEPHTWRMHDYKGVGRMPRHLDRDANPRKRVLLDHLPRLLRGYVRTPGCDRVVVVLDSDRNDCRALLSELRGLAEQCGAAHLVTWRLAIEETEAWYLGDRTALKQAYPNIKLRILDKYEQDSICGTWERLADAITPNWRKRQLHPGDLKHEWASKIGRMLDPETNASASFRKLRDGLRQLTNYQPTCPDISAAGAIAPATRKRRVISS